MTRGNRLFASFQHPPPKYRPVIQWWWSTTIDAAEGTRQLDELRRQGARTVIVYPAHGMRPHFLSEGWWRLWGIFLDHARRRGLSMGMVPDFFHPQGDARDVRLGPPDPSLVLKGHPEYRLKHLQTVERRFSGPGTALIRGLPDPVIASAGRITDGGALDYSSLRDLSRAIDGSAFRAELGEGEWLLAFYHPVDRIGPINVRVDPLNPDATRRYVDLTLGELARRFPDHVGTTFTVALFDAETTFGGPIVWTPLFFPTFREMCGYDLRPYLPLLTRDGGDETPRVRYDYFRVVSHLFVDSFWEVLARWCRAHGIRTIQQSWGDNLVAESTLAGDFMASQREMTYPFMEDLFSWHHSPRGFKEVASIAHFENRPLWVEAQLLEGCESFISPQKMRSAGNVLAAWGVSIQTTMTSYDPHHTLDGHPMQGIEQPHWKFYAQYGDFMQRIGFLNDDGISVAPILLLKPLATVIGGGGPTDGAPDGSPGDDGGVAETTGQDRGKSFTRLVEADYEGLMELLAEGQRDFEVADDHYLAGATVSGGSLLIARSEFKVVLLPRMTLISRASMTIIRNFHDAGGAVIFYGTLPSGSPERGWNDPEIGAGVAAILGGRTGGSADAAAGHTARGTAVFVAGGHDRVLQEIDRVLPADLAVIDGPSEHLYYSHRVKEGSDIYWIANDTGHARTATVSFSVVGKPEIWDAATGERRETLYWVDGGRTVVPLAWSAFGGFAVVMHRHGEAPPIRVDHTNIAGGTLATREGRTRIEGTVRAPARTASVAGSWRDRPFASEIPLQRPAPIQALAPTGWRFTPAADRVEVRYAAELVEPEGRGAAAGYADAAYNHRAWPLTWLSRERFTIRNWWLLGPFPSDNGRGFHTPYPPETELDVDRPCQAPGGETLVWRYFHSRNPWVNVGTVLDYAGEPGVAYAATYVHSPVARRVQARFEVANGKIWVNGTEIYSFYSQIGFIKMNDGFAERLPIRLQEGWNVILLKIESAFPAYNSSLVFRFTDEDGFPAPGLLYAKRPKDPDALVRDRQQGVVRDTMRFLPPFPTSDQRQGRFEVTHGKERWYRVEIPPGTTAFLLPARPADIAVYLNGTRVQPDSAGTVTFPKLDFDQPGSIALRLPADQELLDYLYFQSGPTEYRLGNWTWTGLTYYSGEAFYEKEFDLDPRLVGARVMLDLGAVGLTAEVWLNGRKVGTRLWEPFEIEVTGQLRAGRNRLRVAVTNADASKRGEPSVERMIEGRFDLWRYGWRGWYAPPYMGAIDLNGLVGPLRLIPFEDVSVDLDSTVA